MIRFALKCAFGLGLLAMVVPLDDAHRPTSGVDLVGLVLGAREAALDLGGFCGRAPQACGAAKDVANFAGERIEAGVGVGYAYASGRLAGAPAAAPAPVPAEPAPAEVAATAAALADPVTTGAVAGFAPPAGYRPPVRAALPANATEPAPLRRVPVPTPAPRA